MRIPIFGWYLKKLGMIPLSRSRRKGAKNLKKLLKSAQHAVKEGRQVLIFPEGTRSKPGQEGSGADQYRAFGEKKAGHGAVF